MSVVAWDGDSLAADRQITYAGLKLESCKIREVSGCLLAGVGNAGTFEALVDWFTNNKDASKWPATAQSNDDMWCRLIIIRTGPIMVTVVERMPYEIRVVERYMAWGAGSDFALGAMEMGADAKQAVEIACKYSNACGKGVDVLALPHFPVWDNGEDSVPDPCKEKEKLKYRLERAHGVACGKEDCHYHSANTIDGEEEMFCDKSWDGDAPWAMFCIDYVPDELDLQSLLKKVTP